MSLEQYKDATRKELWEILQIQVERIVELEKERKQHPFTTSDIQLAKIAELEKERAMRDLEQQQLAITRFANKYCGECTSDYQVRLSDEADVYVEYLEALKEQGNG